MGKFGLFNLANAKLGTADGVAYQISPDSLSSEQWLGVKIDDVESWCDLLHEMFTYLNLLGYQPKSAIFNITRGTEHRSILVDLMDNIIIVESTELADSSEDISVSFTSYRSTTGDMLGVEGIEQSLDLNNSIFVTRSANVRELLDANPKMKVNVSRTNDSDYLMELFLGQKAAGDGNAFGGQYYKQISDLAIYQSQLNLLCRKLLNDNHLLFLMFHRWWAATSTPRAAPDESLYPFYNDEVFTNSEWRNAESKALDSDIGLPAGLLWIMNPENWGPAVREKSPTLFQTAWNAWEPWLTQQEFVAWMTDQNLTSFPDAMLGWQGLGKIAKDRFLTDIPEFAKDMKITISESYLQKLSELSYIELIMFMHNCGLIQLGNLTTSAPVDFIDTDMNPIQFFLNESRSELKLSLFNGPPITLFISESNKVYDMMELRQKETGYRLTNAYTLEESCAWELKYNEEFNFYSLIIVAAPGVTITGEGNHPSNCEVVIYRVQSYSLVPDWHTHIETMLLDSTYYLEKMPVGAALRSSSLENTESSNDQTKKIPQKSEEIPAFKIIQKANGIRVEYPAYDLFGESSEHCYKLSIDITISDVTSGAERFAFYIRKTLDPKWKFSDSERRNQAFYSTNLFRQFDLVVHKTSGVKITIQEQNDGAMTTFESENDAGVSSSHNVTSDPWVSFYIYNIFSVYAPALIEEKLRAAIQNPLNNVAVQGLPLTFNPMHSYQRKSQTEIGPLEPNTTTEPMQNVPFAQLAEYEIGTAISLKWAYPEEQGDSLVIGRSAGVMAVIDEYSNNFPDYFWQKLIFDVGVGFIPIVGDAVDVIEFATALGSGKDKWGEPVTPMTLCLMGLGACVPFVSSGVIKGLRVAKDVI